jgi:hypothetical protein
VIAGFLVAVGREALAEATSAAELAGMDLYRAWTIARRDGRTLSKADTDRIAAAALAGLEGRLLARISDLVALHLRP